MVRVCAYAWLALLGRDKTMRQETLRANGLMHSSYGTNGHSQQTEREPLLVGHARPGHDPPIMVARPAPPQPAMTETPVAANRARQ